MKILVLILFVIFILLNVKDCYTTNNIILNGGYEKNPLLKKLMDIFGVLPALIGIKTIMLLIFSTMLYFTFDYTLPWVFILVGCCGFYSWIVYNNWKIMKKVCS